MVAATTLTTMSLPPLNPVFAARPVTIFAVMTALAREHGAINLGQGFPDEDGPREIIEAAAAALRDGENQYAPVPGVPVLRQAVARANKRFYDLDFDWRTETLVTAGATEALASAFLGFLNPGDEAIVLAPCYDSYAPMIEAAGAKARVVALAPPTWRVDRAALDAAASPRTKLIVVNTPHNPAGRAYDAAELAAIAAFCRDRNLIAVADEVYEHIVFDGRPHLPLMAIDGMRERSVRIGSAGKTFSLTGWRIGYVTGPEHLITPLMKAHQFVAYTSPAHLQEAVAVGLDLGDEYYAGLARSMQAKRDFLRAGLEQAGFDALACEGAYFLTVDIRSVGREDDVAFCREITEKAGVCAVPVSAFYPAGAVAPRHLARFCFCKKEDVLEGAAERLRRYFR